MGFDQYHEPANELPQETRTFARVIAALTEEAEAIGWYEQRLAVEPNAQARAIMANAEAGGIQALRDGPGIFTAPRSPSGASRYRISSFKKATLSHMVRRRERRSRMLRD